VFTSVYSKLNKGLTIVYKNLCKNIISAIVVEVVMNREGIIEEFRFMARFVPLTLEQAKIICNTLEEYLVKYPFLREIMEKEAEVMLKEMRNARKETLF